MYYFQIGLLWILLIFWTRIVSATRRLGWDLQLIAIERQKMSWQNKMKRSHGKINATKRFLLQSSRYDQCQFRIYLFAANHSHWKQWKGNIVQQKGSSITRRQWYAMIYNDSKWAILFYFRFIFVILEWGACSLEGLAPRKIKGRIATH